MAEALKSAIEVARVWEIMQASKSSPVEVAFFEQMGVYSIVVPVRYRFNLLLAE